MPVIGAFSPRLAVRLKPRLEALYQDFNRSGAATDPVELVRGIADPADREVAAFLAAGLAFGRVAGLMVSVRTLLERLGSAPARFVAGFVPARDGAVLAGLGHRWTRASDLCALLLVLRHMLEDAGSIEGFFTRGLQPGAIDVQQALESFSRRAADVDGRAAYGSGRAPTPGVRYFFSRPSGGSACKRLNLFLRWMVRCDAIDPGGWTKVSRAQLIVPLDTHVMRLGRCLRLTRYGSPGWKMAADITASLRVLDPRDPVRYDFALCHVGMLNRCGLNRPAGDADCPLRGLCRPGGRRARPSRRPSDRH